MNSKKFTSIKRIAESVLGCLENELGCFVNSCHERFPDDCCDIASSLLYKVLTDEGFDHIFLVRGGNSENLYHVWVEVEEFVIDLTAHQFDDFDEPFILVDRDQYPLNKIHYYSITSPIAPNNNEYLRGLFIDFFKIFHGKYYIQPSNT